MAFFPLSKMSRVLIGSTAWVKKSFFGMMEQESISKLYGVSSNYIVYEPV